jgi:hypothetical protein
MTEPVTRTSTPPLRETPAIGAGPGAPGGPGKPVPLPAKTGPLQLPDQGLTGGGPGKGIPAQAPQVMALTQVPPPGGVLRFDEPNGLGEAIKQLLRARANDPNNPPGSDWTNRNDIRLVMPVMQTTDGAISTSLQTLPGRDQSWATVSVGHNDADSRFNFDGVQGGVRLGIGGPLSSPWAVTGTPMTPGQMQQLEWAEFRLGAEGLIFTGRMVDGKFSLTSLDLEQGFFKAKLDDVGAWAGDNKALAIPLGVAAAGGAMFAVHALAKKTGQDIALPLGMPVYDRNGIFVRPSVRPIFGKDQFIKFGGAEVNLGYSKPGKYSVNVLPGYNNDPLLGPKGMSIGGRATVALPLNGTAGAEVRYNPQGGVSAFAGVRFNF